MIETRDVKAQRLPEHAEKVKSPGLSKRWFAEKSWLQPQSSSTQQQHPDTAVPPEHGWVLSWGAPESSDTAIFRH